MNRIAGTARRARLGAASLFLLISAVPEYPLAATSFLSAEPIPTSDVIGQSALTALESIGYPSLERWSNRLLNDCDTVQNVVDTLTAYGAISTVNATNTSFQVAAGGFEGVTHPSFVFKVRDTGAGAASQADVGVLSNALGYVLSQAGTAHFSPDSHKAYDFALDFAVVTFTGTLTGVEARDFFDYLGTIDAELWSGPFAGFTQVAFGSSATDNSMLFLKPAASKHQFIAGLSTAAATTAGASYLPLKPGGAPTTARAGISFPENDWVAFPAGGEYLSRLGTSSAPLLIELAAQRLQHLEAVANLLAAIDDGNVTNYLNSQFSCPVR
jgi:hypothetical protein